MLGVFSSGSVRAEAKGERDLEEVMLRAADMIGAGISVFFLLGH